MIPRTKQDAVPADVTRDGVTKRVKVWVAGVNTAGKRLWASEPAVKGFIYHQDACVTLAE